MPVPVAAVVVTFNEAANVERCLRSVAGWCHELHVVDSGSTDATLDIARRYTDLVHFHAYQDHASQMDWILHELPMSCEWVLLLDADNVMSEKLKRQIGEALAGPDAGVAGYYSVHQHLFRGRPVRGLKASWLRLVKRSHAFVDRSELVDFRVILDGPAGYLDGQITEYNAKEDDIDFWIDKHQKFSTRMAVEEVLRREGRRGWTFRPNLFGTPDERMSWFKSRWYCLPLFVRPFLYFGYRYILKAGFRDGLNGFVYHFLQAFWFRLLVDVKMADMYRQLHAGRLTLDQLAETYDPSASTVAA